MKDSGVPWLGGVPEHWAVPRLKTLFREVDLRSGTGEEPLLSLRMRDGLVDHHGSGGKLIPPSALTHYKRTEPGELVMNRMRASAGLFAATPSPGLVSPDYAVLRPRRQLELRYFVHLFKTPQMMSAFRLESRGLGTGESGFLRLYTERFGMIAGLLPPLDEQEAIVRLLDHADRRIRRYIRAKQKLIALLEEQKQAIIHRVVTRGLDLGVRLKPSGVAWLGDVPEHWQVTRLKSLVSRVTSGSRGWSNLEADTGALFIRIGNLTRTSIELDMERVVRLQLPADVAGEAARTRVLPGDILLSITAFIGSVAVVPERIEEAYVSQHVACCRPRPGASIPRWLAYVLLSRVGQTHGQLSMYGGTKQGLSLDDVKNYVVLLPPLSEQERLVAWIEHSSAGIDAAVSRARRQVDVFREYRTRLIADVVTGKLDVREAAASLPDEASSGEALEELDPAGDGEDVELVENGVVEEAGA